MMMTREERRVAREQRLASRRAERAASLRGETYNPSPRQTLSRSDQRKPCGCTRSRG